VSFSIARTIKTKEKHHHNYSEDATKLNGMNIITKFSMTKITPPPKKFFFCVIDLFSKCWKIIDFQSVK